MAVRVRIFLLWQPLEQWNGYSSLFVDTQMLSENTHYLIFLGFLKVMLDHTYVVRTKFFFFPLMDADIFKYLNVKWREKKNHIIINEYQKYKWRSPYLEKEGPNLISFNLLLHSYCVYAFHQLSILSPFLGHCSPSQISETSSKI